MQPIQLALDFPSNDQQVFSSFLPAKNLQLVEQLAQQLVKLVTEDEFNLVYLWGGQASGKTHLLKAACQAAASLGMNYSYLNLAHLNCLNGLDEERLPQLVALDNLHSLAGNCAFEEAIFHLFNLAKERNSLLLVAARANPANLGLTLPDLASRLAWGTTYWLEELTDEQKIDVLTLKAKERGIQVAEEVKKYLLHRCPRDLRLLLDLLDKLDAASLQAQRRLTLPFVRSVIT